MLNEYTRLSSITSSLSIQDPLPLYVVKPLEVRFNKQLTTSMSYVSIYSKNECYARKVNVHSLNHKSLYLKL